MNPDELKRVRELLPEAVLRLIDENTRLKTRITKFETALRAATCALQFGCDEKFCAYPDECALDTAGGPP